MPSMEWGWQEHGVSQEYEADAGAIDAHSADSGWGGGTSKGDFGCSTASYLKTWNT